MATAATKQPVPKEQQNLVKTKNAMFMSDKLASMKSNLFSDSAEALGPCKEKILFVNYYIIYYI